MAIQWGGWAMRDAYYGQRVGIDLSRSGRTFTVRYYVETTGSMYYNGYTLNRGGNITGGVSFNWNTGSANTMLVNTATFTGSAGGSYTFSASVRLFWGGTMSVSRSGSIPIDRPSAPTGASASRQSDSRINVSWTRHSSSGAPYQSQAVERTQRNSDGSTSGWSRRANLSGSASSWTDTTATSNQRYFYRVRASNSSGSSGWVGTGGVSTTPAAPMNVMATKQADGSIIVGWTNAAKFQGTGYAIYDNDVQVGTAASGGTIGSTFTWTHVDPDPGVTHTYTITISETDGLVSPKSSPSNTVQLLAPPNAPGSLSPNGTTIAFEVNDFLLTWAHNPVDSSGQTSAQYRFRAQGATTWNTGSVTTGQSVEVSPAMFTPGTVYEWQVRTRGAYLPSDEAGFSPWSAVATLTLMNTPGVSISTPEDGSTVNVSRMTVTWTYFQAQGRAQAGAEVQLVQDPDGDSPLTRESRTVSGAATSLLLNTALADQTTYMVRVRARSGDGLWSSWDESTFTVSYPQPPVPEATVTWDDTQGVAQVSVFNPAPIDPQPATVTNTVERSVDGGNTWELVASDLPLNSTITDPECLVGAPTLYRVEAWTLLPSSSATMVELDADSMATWLSGGDGFGQVVRLPYNPSVKVSSGLVEREVQHFAGRTLGVEMAGTARTRTVSIGSLLIEDDPTSTSSTSEDVEALSYLPAPILYRDPTGRRIYCSMGAPDLSRDHLRRWTLSVTLEEVSRD